MSQTPKPPIFVQRAGYRQRRLRDAAKLIPFVGVVLLLLPLSWPSAVPVGEGGVGAIGLLYVFGAWLLLIVLCAVLSGQMRPSKTDQGPGESPDS